MQAAGIRVEASLSRSEKIAQRFRRGLMLALARAGHIELPALKRHPPNPFIVRSRPQGIDIDRTPLQVSLRELGPITFRSVRRTPEEACFNSLLHTYHYLGYSRPVEKHHDPPIVRRVAKGV